MISPAVPPSAGQATGVAQATSLHGRGDPGELPPTVVFARMDQVGPLDRVLADGAAVPVAGYHMFDSPFGPVVRIVLADGSERRGAPCDRLHIEAGT